MSYVVFSDVGGTIIDGTPWPHLRSHPQFDNRRANLEIVKFLPIYALKKIGIMSETSMRHRWLASMAAIFAGMSRTQLKSMFRDAITGEMQRAIRHDVIEQLQTHKANGATVMLVSGIFADLVEEIAHEYGFDGALGTHLAYENDVATGKIDGVPCVGAEKIQYMTRYLAANHPQQTLDACYGYADSYSDRALLSAVGHSVATYPDDQIRGLAPVNGWVVFP